MPDEDDETVLKGSVLIFFHCILERQEPMLALVMMLTLIKINKMFPKDYITSRISSTIKQMDSSAEVYLFGSRARGDERKDSDWDLLVLSKKPITLKDEQSVRQN